MPMILAKLVAIWSPNPKPNATKLKIYAQKYFLTYEKPKKSSVNSDNKITPIMQRHSFIMSP
jgi:hypothetical protein